MGKFVEAFNIMYVGILFILVILFKQALYCTINVYVQYVYVI